MVGALLYPRKSLQTVRSHSVLRGSADHRKPGGQEILCPKLGLLLSDPQRKQPREVKGAWEPRDSHSWDEAELRLPMTVPGGGSAASRGQSVLTVLKKQWLLPQNAEHHIGLPRFPESHRHHLFPHLILQ